MAPTLRIRGGSSGDFFSTGVSLILIANQGLARAPRCPHGNADRARRGMGDAGRKPRIKLALCVLSVFSYARRHGWSARRTHRTDPSRRD